MVKMKNVVFTIVFVLIGLVMLFSAYKVIDKHNERIKIKKEISKVDINNLPSAKSSEELIKIAKKEYKNDDIVGILKLKGVGIDTFLVQTDDNKYYLNHLIDKTPNKVGSVFVDYRTKIGESKQVNIYGHSSGNYDIPFDNLKKYLDKKFYEENRIITIDTIDGRYTYEIFSVKVTDDEEHLKVKFSNDDDYLKHLKRLKNNSLYEEDIILNASDEILVLQTCIFNNPNGALLIINYRKVG